MPRPLQTTGDLRFARARSDAVTRRSRQRLQGDVPMGQEEGYLSNDPSADSDVQKRRKHAHRNRRLEPDEEAKLLEHAGPHLQRLIIGALESCCRKGELLSLTWRDVNLER